MVLSLSWSTPHSVCPHRSDSNQSKSKDGSKKTGLSGFNANNRENSNERVTVRSSGYTFDPRDYGERRSNHFTMFRAAVFDESSSQIGSNSGNKWQPVSDLEWCRLFDRNWHNKRITMSHSESYMIESNEGKPKIQRKGQGKKGRGRPMTRPIKQAPTRDAASNADDR
ncbi:uncharacterized protein LOC134826208 [Bolinopsis microptera]|uniref:uncharacterized protein LOC134826208 n=1 Tax=Bolinopsis microptera TaxID=2820187 RepID=UPI00307935DD